MTSSRYFVHINICRMFYRGKFSQIYFLEGKYLSFGGMALLRKCIDVYDDYKLVTMDVDLQILKYVIYNNERGNEGKIYNWSLPRLVMST